MPDFIEGGNVGYLSADQWTDLEWAIREGRRLWPWLQVAGYIKTEDESGVRVRSDRPLGVPPTWIAAQEIVRLLDALVKWPSPQEAVATVEGGLVAVALIREVRAAAHKWPTEERPHAVRFIGCPACDLKMLRYNPPARPGDPILVKCRVCGAVLDEKMFGFAVRLIQDEQRRLGERRGRSESSEAVTENDPAVVDRGQGALVGDRRDEVRERRGSA